MQIFVVRPDLKCFMKKSVSEGMGVKNMLSPEQLEDMATVLGLGNAPAHFQRIMKESPLAFWTSSSTG